MSKMVMVLIPLWWLSAETLPPLQVLLLKYRSGGRGLQKSLTDVALDHHEECACVCQDDRD